VRVEGLAELAAGAELAELVRVEGLAELAAGAELAELVRVEGLAELVEGSATDRHDRSWRPRTPRRAREG